MGKIKRPRRASLQVWPRKRANKILPSANWDSIKPEKTKIKHIKGFIGYKVGMTSAYVLDSTPNSLTKNKKIIVPITIIECPPMKILSVRFYKNGIAMKDVLAENLDKELKKRIKLHKKKIVSVDDVRDYDDVRIICYSIVKKTGIKKSPDIGEFGLQGGLEEKLNFIKEHLKKEISVIDVFEKGQLIDFRAVTKGKGFQGPVKRFGIGLKSHKSEKGRRRPGSLGPWHPRRVTFRVPMAGQTGFHTRVIYNLLVLDLGNDLKKYENKLKSIKHYGNLKTDYVLVKGSVQGPAKRQVLMTAPIRETKAQTKLKYGVIELR